ncbi:hypothetical protein BJ741DRAFT_575464 [Chytriomyces cf. hyalinus JEL632]|nr:hypothetical protein BJ741DRAFT_575464 [Chytriomyces cf. hyalinus JEL632]
MRDEDWDGLKVRLKAIQEYNSKSWVRRISRTAHVAYPALLSATSTNLSVVVTPPTLPGSSIEESIHFIDPQTLVAFVYDDLIARDVLATLNDFVLQLRDYPVPLVQISGKKKGSCPFQLGRRKSRSTPLSIQVRLMRHMVHLGKTVFNIGSGDFKLRILGSMTPYYDARFRYGIEGVDIAFGSGAKIEFCNEIPEENIVIECGKLTFSIQCMKKEESLVHIARRLLTISLRNFVEE